MKILVSFFLSFFILFSFSPVFADCNWNEGGSVSESLKDCAPEGVITEANDNYQVTGGLKAKVVRITNQLILAGSLLSVGAIVYAAILYTMAFGDSEKVKKAKSSLKFAIIGFAVMLLSYAIINAIVNLVYGVGK